MEVVVQFVDGDGNVVHEANRVEHAMVRDSYRVLEAVLEQERLTMIYATY